MTAITFPLKKFPGQIEHNHIGFTGKIFIHPALILVMVLLHSLVLFYQGVLNSRLLVSYIPLLYLILVFSAYLFKYEKRNADYFTLTYDELSKAFEMDRLYFKRAFSVALPFFIVLWVLGLQYFDDMGSRMIVNSIILSIYFIGTTLNGVYSISKAVRIIIILVLIEFTYWTLFYRIYSLDIIAGSLSFLLCYRILSRFNKYTPIKLLERLIS
jgi:hypothetical protein